MRLLRQRPVLILWLAETLSVFGDRFFTLALMWTVWDRAGAVAMGVVAMIESIPHILIGAFGRRVLSRFASFRALAVVDAAQVAVVGAMPWLWDSIGLPGVMVVIVLIGTADAITEPNRAALTPELVEKDQVQPVNGLMDLTGRFTWVLGPGTAALLLAFISAETLFLIDAVTFAASALALSWLAQSEQRPDAPASPRRAKPWALRRRGPEPRRPRRVHRAGAGRGRDPPTLGSR
ncbi:MFS transporter [Streptomyces botrytidirepellens]|uniref:MFS transporter n=1 Tax=Streptomyces botrytidirepellens TaxID=2486417 RepID=A0A3M8XCP2_9ACTN|nr:MFS transporter [Streptomyces botrytidirepellens]